VEIDEYHLGKLFGENPQSLERPEMATGVDQTSVGATIVHATAPEIVKITDKQEVASAAPVLRMTDKPIEYSTMAEKWFKVGTYPWDTTMVVGTRLVDLNLPMDAVLDQQLAQGFINNAYWRGDIELNVILNSTQWHMGLLKACWAPNTTRSQYRTHRPALNKCMISNLKGGYIHANAPVSQTMVIPFMHPENYIRTYYQTDTTIRGSLGTWGLHVFSPLQAGTGTSTTVNVTVFVRFPRSEFHLPLGLPFVATTSRVLKEMKRNREQAARRKKVTEKRMEETMKQLGERPQMFHKLKSFANTVQSSAKTVGKIAAVGKDALDIITSLDHEAMPMSPMEVTTKTVGKFNNIDVPVAVDKLAISSQELAPTSSEHFSTLEDECLFAHILTIMSYFTTLVWDTTVVSGTQLTSGLITPTMFMTNYRGSSTTTLSPTILDWVSYAHRFWRGPIDFHIKLVTTSFATGTLRFSVLYGSFDTTVSDEQANSQYFYIMDLKDGQREFDIRVNFPSNTVFKQVHNTGAPIGELYGVGMFYIHVVNALAVADGAPNSVSIECFVSAPEMELYGTVPIQLVPVTATLLKDEDDGVGSFDLLGENPQARIVLGTGGESVPVSLVPMVKIVSIRDLLRRKYMIAIKTFGTAINWWALRPADVFTSSDSPFNYWSSAYAGRRGGLRWVILPLSNGNENWVYTWDPRGGETIVGGMWNAAQMNCFQSVSANVGHRPEIETSFTSMYNYLVSPYAASFPEGESDLQNEGTLLAQTLSQIGSTTIEAIGIGMADDGRLGGFLGPYPMDLVSQ